MLRVESLSYQRGQVPILERVGLELAAGEVLMVRGENGCGKTTLIRLLAGLIPAQPDFKVFLDDEPYHPQQVQTRLQFMYLGHALGIKDELTCLENLAFIADFLGSRSDISPMGSLRSCGLDGYQYTQARRLSAGQRKRLALARFLLCPARIWLLDEPYSNLDAEGLTLVDRLLEKHIGEGGSALITSHGTFIPQVSNHRELILEAA